ncbi:MAG: hypothetical protein ACRDSK_20720 [Actinophytocola sp.]|uniref:hypothetical protein n=1 Tax=Actinophytocola sp. TaxID=1872138 RepID=UPI003D6C49ED
MVAVVAAVTVALVPGQATAATAAPATPAAEGFAAPLSLSAHRLGTAGQAQLDAITAHLPSDWQDRLAAFRAKLDVEQTSTERVADAIDPSQYECGPTAFRNYIDDLLAPVPPDTLFVLALLGVLDYATYDALFFGTPRNTADYGLPAGYKGPITKAFTNAQRFWDVNLFDVKSLAMQSDMLADHARVTRIIGVLFGVSEAEAAEVATEVQALLNSTPGLDGGANPIFTLNAFAFSAEGETDPIFEGIPDKMVFGEGLTEAMDVLGLGTTGAQAVVGHEMAHHVQYEQNLFDSPLTGPEATRRTELMADTFGTYQVAHKRGLGFNAVQLHRAEQAFYEVGDCSFDSPGHHGTPNQRLRAAVFGRQLAAKATAPFPVQPSLVLAEKFEKKLPNLVRPDAKNRPAA